jgi:hypothetical protein
MAGVKFETKRGDTATPLVAWLEDEDGLVSLFGATVLFLMRPVPESGLTAPVVNAPAVVVNPAAVEGDADFGKVRYDWQPDDVAVAGIFRGEFEVTFGVTATETFPSDEYIEIVFLNDLNP